MVCPSFPSYCTNGIIFIILKYRNSCGLLKFQFNYMVFSPVLTFTEAEIKGFTGFVADKEIRISFTESIVQLTILCKHSIYLIFTDFCSRGRFTAVERIAFQRFTSECNNFTHNRDMQVIGNPESASI